MSVPEHLLYTKSHEWVKLDGDKARIGITEHAQEAMGDLVYVELPTPGDSFEAGDNLAVVESVKATSDIYAPMDGTVAAVNEEAAEEPGLVNRACYDAWLVEMENLGEADLLTPEEYEEVLRAEEM